MKYTPRYYQQEAVDATVNYLVEKPKSHPLVICPTGSGKSLILAMLTEYFCSARFLVVSHVKEILEQNIEALEELLPQETIGAYSAGMGRKEFGSRVTVAGVQSVYKHPAMFADVQYVIVDECHMIPKDGDGMYMKLFKALPNAIIIGLTATGFRLGSGYLHKGEGKLFDDVVYDVDIVRLIKEGYLCPLITKDANTKFNTKKIKLIAGDFNEKDMAKRFDKFETTNAIAEELTLYKGLYKHWLLFAINIEHATHLHEALTSLGIRAELVHSKRSKLENDFAIWAYKRGDIQCLISIGKMTTGFNSPHTDLIGLVRPTKSPVLHVQTIGRGLRPAEGKDHCLILDFSGNLERLGPINDVHVAEPGKKGSGESPIKTCPECNTHVPAGANKCYICGYEFPKIESQDLSSSAAMIQAVRTTPKPDTAIWFEVSNVDYLVHKSKYSGQYSLQVRYRCGLRAISEYISTGRDGWAGTKADQWWRNRTQWKTHPEFKLPKTVQEAAKRAQNGELYEPKSIYVETKGKYPDIRRSVF